MVAKELNIGYVPYLPDLSQPGDRRRFPYFARRNNVRFEIADETKLYDIILLTASSNLSLWLNYKKKHPGTRFIFEMTDSLIFYSDVFSTLFKGVGRFLLQKEKALYINYKILLIKWLSIADVVICSSSELKKAIGQWNKNVIISLDYLQSEAKFQKHNYNIDGKLKLVWEGQSVVFPHLLHFKNLFKKVSSFCELHIITDDKFPLYGGLIKRSVLTIIEQLPIETIFHKWELYDNYRRLSEFDCGIIPLNKKNVLAWHKPANKLISFWFTGLPTLTSDTPAYREMMNNAGEDFYCSDFDEWIAKIYKIKNMSPKERETLAKINLDYVRHNYSDEALDSVWMQVFEEVAR